MNNKTNNEIGQEILNTVHNLNPSHNEMTWGIETILKNNPRTLEGLSTRKEDQGLNSSRHDDSKTLFR